MMSIRSLALLFTPLLATIVGATPHGLQHSHNHLSKRCTNSATDRSCWGDYDISTNYYEDGPTTGVVREYWFNLENTTAAPDGIEKQVMLINGSFPGPLIEADWGDEVVVHLTNSLTMNGTSLHFHGIRQFETSDQDGVASITQCPTAPGETTTYRWKAAQYGSSWYHSHFSVQAWDGVFGPIVIHGPATANYDVDMGPVLVNDWFHLTADQMFWRAEYGGPPTLDTGLFNGTNTYTDADTGVTTGARFEYTFEEGLSYRLRLVNAAIDSNFLFSIDNHTLTVIAADFVPIVPYTTDTLQIAMGQRYDIIITANDPTGAGNYWMRAIPGTCADNANPDDIKAIIRYDSTSTADPTTTPYVSTAQSCVDEPIASLVPYVAIEAETMVIYDDEEVTLKGSPTRWYVNGTTMIVDWSSPTLLEVYNNATQFDASEAVIEMNVAGEWTYIIIETQAGAAHPIHLHGHDFFVLAWGTGTYASAAPTIDYTNPPRRDVATLPADGYLVLGFPADNPGVWLMHCHIGWHTSEGLALQFVELQDQIPATINAEELTSTCAAWDAFTSSTGIDVTTDESGI